MNTFRKWILYVKDCREKKSVVAETRTLLTSAKRNVETPLGEVGKKSFIAWPSRRGPSRLLRSRLCNPPEGVVRSLRVFKEQGLLSSWAFSDWLASRGTFKHHQLSGFKQSMFLRSAVFIWKGSASCKNDLGACVRPLHVSGSCEFEDSAVWRKDGLVVTGFPAQ